MSYTTQITLTIPESLRAIANAIAKAFDPDTGGDQTFNAEAVDGVISVTFPCVPEFADALVFFAVSPEALHASVVRDYESRWPELTPPELEDCQAFCSQLQIDGGLADPVLIETI